MIRRSRPGLSVIVLGAAVVAMTAFAQQPTHRKISFSNAYTVPAGRGCDFDYRHDAQIEINRINFETKSIFHFTASITHTNLNTGYALSDVDHWTETYDESTAQLRVTGVIWHLRDASGKLVLVQAGQILYDFDGGGLLKLTPNINDDFGGVICPALGGAVG
jgi:hypothetical protein